MEINPHLLARAKQHELANYELHLGAIARNYFALHGSADDGDTSRRLYIVNPLVAFDYDEDRVIEEISALGWTRPNDTGLNSTNCTLNDVGIAVHQRRHGFHPYAADLAQLVREGRMSPARRCKVERAADTGSAADIGPSGDKRGSIRGVT